MPGCCEHLAARAMPPTWGMAQTHYSGSSKEPAREEVATAPGILGKKQQRNLAQGPGVGGIGVWVFGDTGGGDHVCGVE